MKKKPNGPMQKLNFPQSWVCILLALVMCGVSAFPAVADSGEPVQKAEVDFNVSPIADDEQRVVAIAIAPLKTEQNLSDLVIPLNSTQITLTDPDGNLLDVVICSALDFSQSFKPEEPFFLVKRNKPYYFLVDELTRGGCGGGGGSGTGGGTTNKAITPEGNWTISITGVNNASVFNGTFTV